MTSEINAAIVTKIEQIDCELAELEELKKSKKAERRGWKKMLKDSPESNPDSAGEPGKTSSN